MAGDLIRVMLVDDHAVVRAGLKAVLGTARDIDVVGEAKNGREAVASAERLKPDVIVMDLSMDDMDGATATKEIVIPLPSLRGWVHRRVQPLAGPRERRGEKRRGPQGRKEQRKGRKRKRRLGFRLLSPAWRSRRGLLEGSKRRASRRASG